MHSTMFGFGFLTLIAFLTGGVGLPLGVPPVEDPAMMQVAPAECVAYITWSGMGEADATSQNSTEALMAGPEVQRILAQLDEALTGALLAIPTDEEDSPQAQLAKHGVPLGRLLLSRPTAIFLESVKEGDAGPEVRGGALVNLGDAAPKVSATLVKLQQQFLKESISTVEIPSAKLKATRINLGKGTPEITWAVKGDYLIIGIGEKSLEDMLARLGKPAPAWLTELRSAAHIERVSSIIHVDVQQIKAAAAPIADHDIQQFLKLLTATGLENVQAIDLVSGLDADGFLTQTKISLDGEAKGAATIVSGKPLSPFDLESIPADSTFAVAVRADARELYQLLLETAGNIEPGAEREIDRELRRVEEQTGLHIVDGIFRGLGDVWCAYNSPSEGGLLFTGLTATVNVRDYKRLKPEYDRIHALISEDFERIRGFGGRSQPQVKEIEFAGEKIHFITGQRDLIVAPSFCLTKDQLIFSLFPQNIKALLSRGKDFKSLATSQSVGPQMKMDGGPSVIVYQDARELFKMLYPLLPMMGQAMANQADAEFDLSLLPSVKAIAPHLRPSLTTIARVNGAIVMESRNTLPGGVAGAATPVIAGMYALTIRGTWERAARSQGSNTLKQLALALHMYHDAHGRFPPAFTTDKEGNPLLSWRVAVLPYVEELSI